jgi:4'-phosphopantetheinyl transferase EntD
MQQRRAAPRAGMPSRTHTAKRNDPICSRSCFAISGYMVWMTTAQHSLLRRALEGIAVPRVLIDHRLIAEGDEQALFAEERGAFAGSVIKVQRASGAARIVARELMRRAGVAPHPVVKSAGGMPAWPDGIVGSLAHDATVAVAALAKRADYLSVGVDIEPAEPLASDLMEMVATPAERAATQNAPLRGRLLFSIKEAVYKAAYPLDRVFLDHHDVEVDLAARTAAIRNGRTVPFVYAHTSHIIVLAFVPAADLGAVR